MAHQAVQKLYDLSRGSDPRPWSLTVSFTHPHDPFVARRKYWDLYENCPELTPPDTIAYDDQDPHSKRILDSCDWNGLEITPEHIRRARQAYFANISYIDDKIGEILGTLTDTRQEAVIVFVSDHGEMLGRRGLWFKMNFFEGAARVPLMIAASNLVPSLITTPVCTIDITPTLCDLAGISMDEVMDWTDGQSLYPLAKGTTRLEPVAMEYAAEGSIAPMVALRDGAWKYIQCRADPEMLFNLESDPDERNNLATDLAHLPTLERLRAVADARWDLMRFDSAVRESQARRWVVYKALRQGGYYPWDYQPLQKASERYMRNHMDLNILEDSKRFPRGE